jgi:hypothetical protein
VEGDARGSRLSSFLLGGLVGGLAGLAAGRLRSQRAGGRTPTPPGLAAFERAPCYEELLEQDARDRDRR